MTSAAAPAPIRATRYAAARLTQAGGVRGAVEIDGEVPADTMIRPTSDREVCGDSVLDVTVERDGNRLAGAVVWIDGVKGGKPLPLARRYELDIEQCLMLPRTQAALVGGTLNVRNEDRALHRTRFLRQGTRDPVATIPYSDDGQVVPVTAALERPGLVEARCDEHPWGRAWIAVFDQPYFALSAGDGSFAIDSVPPGKYTLIAWHPRLGLTRDTLRVVAGRETDVTLRMKGGAGQ